MGGGLIIRLIDLVFILLFGFIVISQIDATKELQPAESTEAASFDNDSTRVIIVGVRKDGVFPINDGSLMFSDSTGLQQYLAEQASLAQQTGKPLGIRIRANFDTPVHYSLMAAQICSNLGLPKGLDVVKVVKRSM